MGVARKVRLSSEYNHGHFRAHLPFSEAATAVAEPEAPARVAAAVVEPVEPPVVEPPAAPTATAPSDASSRALLVARLAIDAKARQNVRDQKAEAFQRARLAVQLANPTAPPKPKSNPVVAERAARALLTAKFVYDAKERVIRAEKARQQKAELFQRARLAVQLANAPASSSPAGRRSTTGPLSSTDDAALKEKYAAIDDLGERAFAMLSDLGMFAAK